MSEAKELQEYVLRPGGEIIRRFVSESQIAVPDNVMAALNKDVNIPLHGLAAIDQWGWMGMMVTGGKLHYCTVPVQRIILRTAFEMVDKKEKIFCPNFSSSDPAMELTWKPPGDMAVLILMAVQQHKDADFSIPKAFLYALDEKGQYWKLPLSNVFEDGAICEGRNVNRHPTLLAAVLDMLQTFDHSRWNRDLWNGQENTYAMFRFVSAEEGKFEVLPPTEKKWTKLCTKIVTDVQKNIVL